MQDRNSVQTKYLQFSTRKRVAVVKVRYATFWLFLSTFFSTLYIHSHRGGLKQMKLFDNNYSQFRKKIQVNDIEYENDLRSAPVTPRGSRKVSFTSCIESKLSELGDSFDHSGQNKFNLHNSQRPCLYCQRPSKSRTG